MPATNFTPIQIYHSTTASAVPTSGNLVNGELAINITDGKLYYKDNGGTVQVIATKATGTIGGSNTQVQYNSSGSLAGSANFTFNGTTATINTLNLTNALGAAYGGTAQSTYTQGDLLYASATNTLSKLAVGSNTYILTSNGTIPGWAAPSAISVNTATNLAGGTAGAVPYQSGAGATVFLSIGTANQVITSTGSLPQWSSGLSITTLTASDAVTFSATTQNIALGTSQTSGTFTVGGAAQTGTQTFDQSTKTHTLNVGTGATESGLTKTINIGTGGVSTSTTAINIGSTNGTTVTLNGTVNATTLDLTNLEVTNIKAKDGTASITLADSTGVATLSANPILSGGTANGVTYLNASKALTSGSALTFDGTRLAVNGGANGSQFSVKGTSAFVGFDTGAANDGRLEFAYNGTKIFEQEMSSSSLMTLKAVLGVSLSFGANNAEGMRLTSTGLGIGTSSPTHKLQVSGSGRFGTMTTGPGLLSGSSDTFQVGLNQDNTNTTNTQVWAEYVTGATSASWAIRYRAANDTGTASTRLFLDAAAGNLGIGTSSPTTKLDVLGFGDNEVRIRAGSDPALTFSETTANKNWKIKPSAGDLYFQYSATAYNSGYSALARITSTGNLQLGGTASRATTVGTAHLDIFNGTAPVGTLTNGISIYSSSGEAYVMDAAGNATLFSPHDAETNEWIFRSKHTPTGKVLKIDVEKMLRFINDHFGLDAIHEFTE
jgi:hypothetical protein